MPKPEIVIRRLTSHDYASVVAVWQEAGLPIRPQGRESRSAYVQQLQDDHIIALGAFAGADMVGVVIGSHDGRKGWINRLAVVPGWQKQGIAKELVKCAENFFTLQGIMIFAALIEVDNASSMTLFNALGYDKKSNIIYVRKLLDSVY